jgi:hypothetical protein
MSRDSGFTSIADVMATASEAAAPVTRAIRHLDG